MLSNQNRVEKKRRQVLRHIWDRAQNPEDPFSRDDLDRHHRQIAYRAAASRKRNPTEGWLTKLFGLYRNHFNPETPTEKREVSLMAYSLFDDNREAFLSQDLNVELSLRPISELINPMISHNSRHMLN